MAFLLPPGIKGLRQLKLKLEVLQSLRGDMSDKYSSFVFCLPNYTLSAIVSSGCDLLFSSFFLYFSSYL